MTKDQFIGNVRDVLNQQVIMVSNSNKAVGFFKPLLQQLIDKNVNKIEDMVSLFADKEGNLDISEAINEMTSNALTMAPFKLQVPIFDEIEIGGGHIKIMIPFINKEVLFDSDDLQRFRETLLKESNYGN